MCARKDETVSTRRHHRGFSRISAGPGRLAEPVQILLGNRSLTWLVVAFGALTIAEWGYVTALAVDAFRLEGAIAVGFVGFRLFFAAIGSVFSLPYVERHPGARTLTVIAGTRAVIVAVSAALAASGAPLFVLLILVALDAVVSGPYRPAQSTMLPALARTPRELAASAAGISIVKTLAQALGAMGGGFLLVVTTPATVFAAAAALLLVAAVVTIRFAGVSVPTPIAVQPSRMRERTRGTFDVIREPHVAGLLTVSGLRTFVRGMWIAIAVIASLRLLHAGSAGVGLLMMAAGVGSLVAVPLSGRLIDRRRLGTPTALALITCGIPLAVIGWVPKLDVALALVAVWGIGMAVADVATLSLLYRLLDIPLLPRVTALIESSKLALEGLGGLLAPLLVTTIGIRGALVAAACPLPVVVCTRWRMLHRLDASAGERTQVLTLLHGVPCLEPLDMASLGFVATAVVRLDVDGGTDLVCQGDPGDSFYVVRDGTADVLVDGFCVGTVVQGASFGERALLRNVPRTATVRSRGPMQLLTLSREAFLTALTGHALATGPTVDPRLHRDASEWTEREKADQLSRLNLFSHLDSGTLRQLAQTATVDQWSMGATIIRQGDEGDRFFVMLDGTASVSVGEEVVGELHPGDQFGEIALLHGVPRTAGVTASSQVTTLSLHRDDFASAVRSRAILG
jgi:CRP-like cAMP-binding protein/predicted MFS family arabinose efflux permease